MANTSIQLPYQQASGSSVDPRLFNQYQNQLKTALSPITNQPMAKSTILSGVNVGTNPTTIQTNLGYPLTGWYIIRQRSNAIVWDSQDSNSDKSNTLILNASASVTVDLVVF